MPQGQSYQKATAFCVHDPHPTNKASHKTQNLRSYQIWILPKALLLTGIQATIGTVAWKILSLSRLKRYTRLDSIVQYLF
ncbi:hypothetical protein RSAG8_12856, partial [Rhizoctonia solani AG-8 WAC10335]